MRHIWITGASRGIGFETARLLAADGHHVIATARSTPELANLKSKYPDRIRTFTVDLTDLSGLNRFLSKLESDEIFLDGLIHNAGVLINKPFDLLTDEDWYKMMEVNLMIPVRLTRLLLPRLARGAHVLHISSMGGYPGSSKFPGLTGYSTSKGGLSILTECLATEFASRELFFNCLCLGAVNTEMLQEAFPGYEAPLSAAEMGSYIADFIRNGHCFYNGKVLPVALHDPE